MSQYSLNDILNVLWLCGIRTVSTLQIHLRKAGHFISDRTVRSKVLQLEKYGEIIDRRKGHSGRKKVLSARDQTRITALLESKPELDAAEVKKELRLCCSTNVIREFLHKTGFKFLRVIQVPRITKKHREDRLAFAKRHKKDDWGFTFFLDESTFMVGSFKTRCYQKKNDRKTFPVDKHPSKLHIIGMISIKGATRLIMFQENLRATNLKEYLKALKKEADKLYSKKFYRFAMDKDSKHTSGTVQKFLQETRLEWLEDWPASSPDLNPIENLWGLMEKEIKKLYIKNLYSLRKSIPTIWRRLTKKEKLRSLISSMPERLKAVISSKGSNTRY